VAEAVSEIRGLDLPEQTPAEVRIDLPVDAHLPEAYVDDQELRLEGYRRLASTTTNAEVDDVVAEWLDRYGPLPKAAKALIELARLRVEAIRVGIGEIVKLRNEVRLGPVDLKPSQEVRLQRLQPRSVLRAGEAVLFIPAREPLVENLIGFLASMWPSDEEEGVG
jgi:transcription-repair coupling factor (superfamily II helicase)